MLRSDCSFCNFAPALRKTKPDNNTRRAYDARTYLKRAIALKGEGSSSRALSSFLYYYDSSAGGRASSSRELRTEDLGAAVRPPIYKRSAEPSDLAGARTRQYLVYGYILSTHLRRDMHSSKTRGVDIRSLVIRRKWGRLKLKTYEWVRTPPHSARRAFPPSAVSFSAQPQSHADVRPRGCALARAK